MVIMCIVSAADMSPCNFKGNELFSYEVNKCLEQCQIWNQAWSFNCLIKIYLVLAARYGTTCNDKSITPTVGDLSDKFAPMVQLTQVRSSAKFRQLQNVLKYLENF